MSNRNKKIYSKSSKKKNVTGVRKADVNEVLLKVVCTLLVVVILTEVILLTIKANEYFGFVSYDDLNKLGEVNVSVVQGDGYYTVDQFMQRDYSETLKNVNNMHDCGLLTDKVYDYLVDGLNSDYFQNTAMINYEVYQQEADTFMKACAMIENMAYAADYDISECDGTCQFEKYLETYINEDSRDKYKAAHEQYHKAIKAQRDNMNLTDGELKYYYETYLLCYLDNIEEIEVELTYLTAKNLNLPDKVLNWYVRSPLAESFRHSKTLTITNKEALSYFDLSYDAGLFDSTILPSVANLLYQIGNELENSSGADVKIIDITGIDDYESYVKKKKAEQSAGVNIRDSHCFYPISISDRYEGEQIYVIFRVKSCKHKESLPSYQEFINSAEFENILINKLTDDLWIDIFNNVRESSSSEGE